MNRKWKHSTSEFKVEYSRYRAMRQRTNVNVKYTKAIKNYTSKGIGCCTEWNSFDSFMEDMGKCPKGYELDRIDNGKGYSKENCRWVPRAVNQYNRNKFSGSLKKGVRFHKKNFKFTAQICIDFHSYYLGSFKTETEASEEYNKIAKEWYGFIN